MLVRGANQGVGRHLCGVWEELLVLLFDDNPGNGNCSSSRPGKKIREEPLFLKKIHEERRISWCVRDFARIRTPFGLRKQSRATRRVTSFCRVTTSASFAREKNAYLKYAVVKNY